MAQYSEFSTNVRDIYTKLRNDVPLLHKVAQTQVSRLKSLDMGGLPLMPPADLEKLGTRLYGICSKYEAIFCGVFFDGILRGEVPEDLSVNWEILKEDIGNLYPFLRSMARRVSHRAFGQEPILLPSSSLVNLDLRKLFFYRRVMAQKLVFLTCWEPSYFRFRKNVSDEIVRDKLPAHHHWLLDPTCLPTVEWQAFIMALGPLQILCGDFLFKIGEFRAICHSHGVAIPPMNESGELTVEAFTSRTSSQENQFPICLNQYHNEDCSIFTKCNHEMGRECLQTWFNEDNITCPICRQILLERADFIPEPCRKYFHDLEYVVKRALQLDPEACRYAQEGMLRVCSWEYGAYSSA